ncbi:T9SS type A sorting domain-containing protein [Hymenobacter busanensis]|uniref:T9SS type A sorting domain-containing protein n=1 Tax=Hymenobacter busanensis TaxID=2607656 RepID=A0A7L4ZVR4_9BACT|nr:T9SS type A sorting domain-containing protein [Hymenobacter busanensis]KAA9332365.1 T9SS type A sorting domain-containing protein [Hymenobacter busanensis]QHJ07298.1 T9SS type A sorting domain-containing protein [Hymenobacter busanensis]
MSLVSAPYAWLIGAFALGVPGVAQAQLVSFSFAGALGSETSLPPNAQPAAATASAMTRGAGLTPSLAGNSISAADWTTAASPDPADYFAFSIQPAPGSVLRLDSLRFDERRSGTGILAWAVRSSLDNFTANLATATVPDDTNTRTDQRVTLPTGFRAVGVPVEFRFYGYSAESASGTWRLQNVRLYGQSGVAMAVQPNATVLLACYPVPSSSVLYLRPAQAAEVELFDLAGGMRLQQHMQAHVTAEVSVAQLTAGVYWLRTTAADGRTATQRIVVQR